MRAIHTPIRKSHRSVPAQNDNFSLSRTHTRLNPGRILAMRNTQPVSTCVIFGLALVLVSGGVFSLPAQEVKFSAKEPALLTTAGQSADLNMAKVLLDR